MTLKLIELCVSECYLLWDSVIWNLLNSGPIGLSIMVVLSEGQDNHYCITLKNLLLNWLGCLALHLKHFVDTDVIPMPDLEVEIMLLNFWMVLIVTTSMYLINNENDNKELIILELTVAKNLNNSHDSALYLNRQ